MKKANDLKGAKKYYEKAIGIARAFGERSWEVGINRKLAQLEWDRGDVALAKSYLDSAFVQANSLNNHNLLADVYELKAEIAEAEKRFEEALLFTQKKHKYGEWQDSAAVDFDPKKYYLQLEKDQLATEKEAQALALQLKSNQLNYSIALVMMAVLAAIGLYVGFRKQRQRKEELAAQNTLIQEQSEQLKQLDTSKSRFFANVSHELRTPISLVLGPIGTVLKRKQLEKEDRQLLQMAKQGGQNLQLLVNEILDLGKLESGKMELVHSPVHLASYFKNYFVQFESLGYQKGITYGYDILMPKNMAVQLDKEKCRQLVFNLLSNAFKFSSFNGQINVVLKMDGHQLQLEVSDTGKGIHPDDLPHVFDRYFQANRSNDAASGGTGIGLSLCQQYAKLFGGGISVESTLGKGSIFKVEFPVEVVEGHVLEEDLSDELASNFKDVKEKPDQFILPATAPDTHADDNKKPTVLVAEDNVELQRYLQLVLKDHYQVALAENGQAAMDHIAANGHPDLIVSDLMMPVMDGYQFLKQLKSDPATEQIPAIMLTARAEKDDRLKALRIGVDDYMTKPFDEEELLVRIANLLSNQSVRRTAAIEEELLVGKATDGHSETDREWLGSFEQYTRQHLSNNQLSVLQLADEFAMSNSTLLRQLKRLTGLTPRLYLAEVRLDEARRLLAEGRFTSVGRVAHEVGFMDVRGFSKNFVKRYGKKPSEIATG